MNFQYLRPSSTPEKKTQRNLQRVVNPVERKLLHKFLQFIDRL